MTEVSIEKLSDFSQEVQLCENATENLKSYASRMWHKEFCTTKVVPQKEKIQIKYLNNAVRIYCLPFNITINDETRACPDYVFEVGVDTVHRIAGMELHGQANLTVLDGDQIHLLREIRSMLNIDNIQLSASNFVKNIGESVSGTTGKIATYVKNVPESVRNATMSWKQKIQVEATEFTAQFTKGYRAALDTIYSYIEWAGIILSVLAAGILLILAASILEVVFLGVKLVKIPYRYSMAAVARLLAKWNAKTQKKATEYIDKAKLKLRQGQILNKYDRLNKVV